MIENAGVEELSASRRFIAIRKPISLIEGEKRISIIPSRFFRITFDIAFEHKAIALQQYSMKFSADSFQRDIAPARTFGFLHEVEYLKANVACSYPEIPAPNHRSGMFIFRRDP